MSDFDRLFEQSNELRGKSDGDTSGFRGWTLILVLAISAIGTMVTFSVRAPSSLHIETKSDFLTVAMETNGHRLRS